MVKIPYALYQNFKRKYEAKVWPHKRFGQAFYDEFLRNQEPSVLYDKIYNAEETSLAKKLISELIKED